MKPSLVGRIFPRFLFLRSFRFGTTKFDFLIERSSLCLLPCESEPCRRNSERSIRTIPSINLNGRHEGIVDHLIFGLDLSG